MNPRFNSVSTNTIREIEINHLQVIKIINIKFICRHGRLQALIRSTVISFDGVQPNLILSR